MRIRVYRFVVLRAHSMTRGDKSLEGAAACSGVVIPWLTACEFVTFSFAKPVVMVCDEAPISVPKTRLKQRLLLRDYPT